MPFDPKTQTDRIAAGDRRALAQAITLVESTRQDHRADALSLLDHVSGLRVRPSFRVGITGTPGVGKSTFIETFGLHLCDAVGLRVAVLAVDPSSTRTGGSILGDKTRMAELSRHPSAYIRPTPSGGTLGGVARRTRDVIRLVEAAAYDVVLIETVGVGQSETAVSNLSDAFVLLVAPGGGDELQGVKRGIMELADIVVVNKCDGALEPQARSTLADYTSALRLIRPSSAAWTPVGLAVSSLSGFGVSEVWSALMQLREARESTGEFSARRTEQQSSWLWTEVAELLLDDLRADDRVAVIEGQIRSGQRSIASGVDEIRRLAHDSTRRD